MSKASASKKYVIGAIIAASMLVPLAYLLSTLFIFKAGDASAFQDTPPVVSNDGTVDLALRVAVLDLDAPAFNRFTDMQLQFRPKGADAWTSVSPTGDPEEVKGNADNQLLYRFKFPLKQANVEYEYHFTYRIDGHPKVAAGHGTLQIPSEVK
ncbi:hypothetical protein [Azohydromonas lata]|uniref:Uncharacterized protein n=1 Tax=Azohydromonas lata TaxID=45677 RepID=A0ABU5IBE6_9BURK|nr:hypothetical protein [Azohydromonas lata]MDZ5456433.1 hypothetical protein [Azohydromonas lata]